MKYNRKKMSLKAIKRLIAISLALKACIPGTSPRIKRRRTHTETLLRRYKAFEEASRKNAHKIVAKAHLMAQGAR
jgi:ribosomal protein L17